MNLDVERKASFVLVNFCLRLRQFDPAFVVAPSATVTGCVDDDGEVVPELAGAGVLIEINEELAADDFEPPLALEVLTGQADLAVKFVKFEHDETTSLTVTSGGRRRRPKSHDCVVGHHGRILGKSEPLFLSL